MVGGVHCFLHELWAQYCPKAAEPRKKMGNTIVINVSATKDVEAGSTVTGTVYVSVRREFVQCTAITGSFEGMEWISPNKSGNISAGFPNEPKNFTFLPFIVQDFPNGRVPRGQYEYPFQFMVPPGAPASMFKTVGNGGGACGITYKLTISAMDRGTPTPKFKTHMVINVARSALQGSKTPMYLEPSFHPMTSGCFNKGSLLIGGCIDASVLVVGERCTITFGLINNSTVLVHAFEMSIFEEVSLKALGKMPTSTKRIVHKRLNLPQAVLDLSPRGQQDDLHELNTVLDTAPYKIEFELPLSTRSTFHGWRSFVSHKLVIRAFTGFGTANPLVSRELIVYSDRHSSTPLKSPWNVSASASLPGSWQPIIANINLLPTPVLSKAPLPPMISAPPPSMAVPSSFEEFLFTLKASCDPCGELQFYFRSLPTAAAELTPEQIYVLFLTVSGPLNQLRVADILATALPRVSCALIARALAACRDPCKREVAEKLLASGRVVDKELAHLIKAELRTPFQYVTIEKYLC